MWQFDIIKIMGSPETSQGQEGLEKVCGNCKLFDPKNVNNRPFGKETLSSGIDTTMGVCRAPLGLIIGILNERTGCKQPPGIFQPNIEQ
ncbi:MAG: hypothetical protein AAB600_03300 [Patescibacteria group bacterium]